MGAQLGLVQCLPLAACPQDEEDGVRARAISDAWPPTPKAMGIDMGGQQRLENGPQLIGDAKPRRRPIIRRSLALSWVGILLAHSPSIAGYSDRL
jgi:hypothetical protein